MQFSFETDEETKRLFKIAVHFLQRYFNHSEQVAINLTNDYYENWKTIHEDDDFYHHEGAFHVAVRVHYFASLDGDAQLFLQWKLDNGYISTPREALDYFREHYFTR